MLPGCNDITLQGRYDSCHSLLLLRMTGCVCVCLFTVTCMCVCVRLASHLTQHCILIVQTKSFGFNAFCRCLSSFFVNGCYTAWGGQKEGREARDKERLISQWKRRKRGRWRERQVQWTPGTITGALQKRWQEIKVVLVTWHYRLSMAISELTSESRWKWCCVGFQERRGKGRRAKSRRKRSSRWGEKGWTMMSTGNCI